MFTEITVLLYTVEYEEMYRQKNKYKCQGWAIGVENTGHEGLGRGVCTTPGV